MFKLEKRAKVYWIEDFEIKSGEAKHETFISKRILPSVGKVEDVVTEHTITVYCPSRSKYTIFNKGLCDVPVELIITDYQEAVTKLEDKFKTLISEYRESEKGFHLATLLEKEDARN